MKSVLFKFKFAIQILGLLISFSSSAAFAQLYFENSKAVNLRDQQLRLSNRVEAQSKIKIDSSFMYEIFGTSTPTVEQMYELMLNPGGVSNKIKTEYFVNSEGKKLPDYFFPVEVETKDLKGVISIKKGKMAIRALNNMGLAKLKTDDGMDAVPPLTKAERVKDLIRTTPLKTAVIKKSNTETEANTCLPGMPCYEAARAKRVEMASLTSALNSAIKNPSGDLWEKYQLYAREFLQKNRGKISTFNSGQYKKEFVKGLVDKYTPRLMYQKSEANGFLYSDVGSYSVPGPATPAVSMTPSNLTQYRFFDIPESSTDAWTLLSVGVKYDASHGTFFSSTSYFDRTVDETEDQTDFLYQNLEAPFDGAPFDVNNPNSAIYHAVPLAASIRELKQIHRFVQEFRFTSKLSGPLQYVVGFFYSDTRGRVPYAGYYPPSVAPGISQTGGFIPPPAGVLGIPVNPLIPDEIFGQDYQTKVSEPALYGEVSYQFLDNLKGTLGLRGYRIKTTTGGYLEGIAFGGARITDPTAETTDTGVNPKVGLDWTVAPGKMIYGQVAKGFRPGGLVPSIPGSADSDPLGCYAQLTALGYTSTAQTKSYKPDKLWNAEVGAKTAWAQNRITVDGAGFFIKWDDIQQLVALPCGFQFRANAGAAEIKGAELEVHGRPTHNLDLSAGAGYQQARITKASVLLPALQVGDRVYYVPDWTANAAIAYSVPFGDNRSLVGTLDWVYTGDSVSASVSATTPRVRPSYSILDARLAYEVGNYEFALVGKNLANTLANLGDNRSLAAETIGRPRLVVNTPRTIGVELRARF